MALFGKGEPAPEQTFFHFLQIFVPINIIRKHYFAITRNKNITANENCQRGPCKLVSNQDRNRITDAYFGEDIDYLEVALTLGVKQHTSPLNSGCLPAGK